jgi:2-oxo-3-hexenedioate decarboxylase
MGDASDPGLIVREMKAAQDGAGQIEPFTARFDDFDNAAAYDVARRIHRARIEEGWTPVGRKIGFTNAEMWALYGVREPIWGPMYDRTVVFTSGAPAQCDLSRFTEPRIEPEVVLRFHATPSVAGDPVELLACIDWIAHGFEVVQSHFPGWRFGAPDAIADGSLHAALFVGEPRSVGSLGANLASDLQHFEVVLACDGAVRERGRGANVLGSPLTAAAHLVAVLARQGVPLQAGELVTTGTLTQALPVLPGQTWTTELTGIALPGPALTFTP